MITGVAKTKVDDIWQRMWEGGITNPLEVITQLTYLMFIRSLDVREFDVERMEALTGDHQKHVFPQTPQGKRLRWNTFKDLEAEEMHHVVANEVFPFIKSLNDGTPFARCMKDATFGIQNPKTLQRAVSGIDELMKDFDSHIGDLGDLYEYMLSKLSTAGTNGQFRTPRHIREMMVELVRPRPGELICDPACGTAGFLISAAEHIRKHYGETNQMSEDDWAVFTGEKDGRQQFSGFETDQTMLRISTMNMMLHSVELPDIRYMDSVSKNNTIHSKFDLILANPPFTGSVDAEDIDPELVEHQKLDAIIHMPSGVFKPYSGVSTAILVFTKTDAGGTDNVWMYNMEGDGYTLDDKRSRDEKHDDVPDVVARFANLDGEKDRARTEKSFLVPKQEIADNDYDFSFNKYTQVVYEKKEYPPTSEILAELDDLNRQMAEDLSELREMLGGDFE